ncbi:hypothetical protein HMPREF9153_1391 [Cutibacterium avidum ATCC 25577]|uniref:Uncharacterized protein n=1 Tax=Cutibacterium avidum ATCC 25577 TaxID=997355 RepID=G4CXY4_9ACTN|nr:hypothetical protein HMPREF9153_1391 [Cutibacterium avidum ATCC 25577]
MSLWARANLNVYRTTRSVPYHVGAYCSFATRNEMKLDRRVIVKHHTD